MIEYKNKLEKTLSELVKIPSVSGDRVSVNLILKRIENMCKGLPVKTVWLYKNTNHPALYVATRKGFSVDLLLFGHVDVVPASDNLFKLVKKDDILYGRGVCDMKGSVAVIIEAFKTVTKENYNKSIAMLFTTDEETGGKSAELLSYKIKPKAVFVPDGGDSEYRISNSTRGILQVSIEVKGRGGSVSGVSAEKGNAIEVLMKKYLEWKKIQKKSKYSPDIQITYSNGGIRGNVLPNNAEIFLDIRFQKIKSKKILNSLKKVFKSDSFLEYTIIEKSKAEPSFLSLKNPFLKNYKSIAEKVLNKPIEVRGQNGSHDGRFFSEKGVPVIATRIRSGSMHSDKEWASLNAMNNLYNILITFLAK